MKNMIHALAVTLAFAVVAMAEDVAAPAPEVIAAPAATAEVLKSALGSGIDRETRTVLGEATSFDASVTNVVFLTRVKSSVVPTTVNHVYSVDGQEVNVIPLAIKGSPWTTWSSKVVWPGSWKVEVKDEAGNVLTSQDFTVSKEMAAPAPVESAPPAN